MTYKDYCKNELGYDTITTFWDDFSIAEHFGLSAIKDTFKRAFNEWKSNYKYITELTMVMNHKIWNWYERNKTIAEIYQGLFEKVQQWCEENLKGEELQYYYRVTD